MVAVQGTGAMEEGQIREAGSPLLPQPRLLGRGVLRAPGDHRAPREEHSKPREHPGPREQQSCPRQTLPTFCCRAGAVEPSRACALFPAVLFPVGMR